MANKSYQVNYKILVKPAQFRVVEAQSVESAKAFFRTMEHVRGLKFHLISCELLPEKPVEKSKAKAKSKPRPKKDVVVDRLEKAEIIEDVPIGDAELIEPKKPKTRKASKAKKPPKLTVKEWKILERCATFDENDADNAKRLLNWFGTKILHVLETGWFHWTGNHWDYEDGELGVQRYAQDLVGKIKREAALIKYSVKEQLILDEADKIIEEEPDASKRMLADKHTILAALDIVKANKTKKSGRWKFAIKSGDRARTMAMINQAVSHRTVTPADLDTHDYLFNCQNGTISFEKVEDVTSDPENPTMVGKAYFKKHNPKDLITKVANCDYDETATAPNFLKDLERFMPDDKTREFLQVFMGYVIIGGTGEQVYTFFYGDGANWKSAFLQAIARTIGSFHKPMSYTSISGNNMPTGDKPSPDWARLPGVRFLTIEEVPRKEPIKEELIKMVTSGAEMPVRHLNKGLFDMMPKFTTAMTCNAEPNISGHDKGIWRRTIIVPWTVTIPESERLPFDQVMRIYDAEQSGILNWLVEGACKYLTHGLFDYVTDEMRDFTASVRADRDAVGAFVDDCMVEHEGAYVTVRDLYTAFDKYCTANGFGPILKETAFARQVKHRDINGVSMVKRKVKVQGYHRYNNVKLVNIPDDPSTIPAVPDDGYRPPDDFPPTL